MIQAPSRKTWWAIEVANDRTPEEGVARFVAALQALAAAPK